MFIHKYVVEDAEQITASTLLLSLKSKDKFPFTFQPGQYAAISFSHNFRPTPARCFSIVSSPTQQETLQFSMRTRGRFTTALSKVKKGDIVKVRGPFGGFVFDAERDKDVVLLAGGIGITPFMSMVRFASTIHADCDIVLVYSCASQDDVPFRSELIKMQDQNPRLKVVFVIGHGPVDKFEKQEVKSGRITPELLDEVTGHHYGDKTFFLCGPPPFINAAISTLRAKDVSRSQIMTEAFSQGSRRQTGQIRSWPYNMYALSAVGLSLGSVVVMASDLLKSMPSSSLLDNNTTEGSTLTNGRQQDLDKLVNQLPALDSHLPVSKAVSEALAKVAAAESQIKANSSTGTVSQTGSSTQGASAPTTQSTPVVNTTPTATAPQPTPICTTTPSGVTTC
ncbi:MAG: hypothetical protein H6797_03245 [Candidatus Nomurabacteria bacterium]|nr:MAG: hypothetical protein H6797_03245 [Candidatus Nomurabacteria bacterium]